MFALKKFDYVQYKAAEWLGMSARTMRTYFYRYPELHPFTLSDDELIELEELKERVKSSKGYQFAENKKVFMAQILGTRKRVILNRKYKLIKKKKR